MRISFDPKDVPDSSQLFDLTNENYTTGSPWSVNGFEEDLKSVHAHYGMVLLEQKCIGFIGYHNVFGEAEITNFVVAKKFQRQGIASQLLQCCLEKWCVEKVEQVFLEVRESNQSAIQLYKKMGFITIGTRKQYYKQPIENALIMQLTLS